MFGNIEFQKQNNESEPVMPEIVTFQDGTDEQIKAMLDAHYTGLINIENYWSVGDTRKIHLNNVANPKGSGSTWVAQDITIVITAMDQYDLETSIGTRTKAAIVCQTRECVNNSTSNYGTDEHIGWNLQLDYITNPNTVHWTGIGMRTWANETFYNTAMPEGTKSMIKPVKRKVLSTRGCSETTTNGSTVKTTETVTDKIFIPTYPEICGNTSYRSYLSGSTPTGEEGTQWQYYKTTNNRIKYGNNNGNSNSTIQIWWIGSPSTNWGPSYGGYWCAMGTNSSVSMGNGADPVGFAPAFCL